MLCNSLRASLLFALLSLLALRAAPLPVAHKLWVDVALQAAERTIEAVQKQTALELSLQDVPLESLELFIGRQHQLALEVDGKEYAVVLNADVTDSGPHRQPAGPRHEALPAHPRLAQQLPASALTRFEPSQWQAQHISLPEITLAGPVELVLSQPTAVNMRLPHAADADRVRRLLVAPGATLTLSQLRSISLRKPLQLPRLPVSYLAEVHASARLGQDEPGFENAPGMFYLASQLYRAATNASLGAQAAGGTTPWLLSFDIEPAGNSIDLVSAPTHPALPAPRLKAKKTRDGSLEVSVRGPPPQTAPHAAAASRPAAVQAQAPPPAQECDDLDRPRECSVVAAPVASLVAQTTAPPAAHRLWAWPMPLVDMGEWVPYETLLRTILTSKPFDAAATAKAGGLGLRLTRSSVRGVALMHFDMHLRGAEVPSGLPDARDVDPNLAALEDAEGAAAAGGSLQVWEAVVQVQSGAAGGLDFVPVSVKRKHAYHSTLTLSRQAIATLTGASNVSLPLGYESHDLGLARSAAEAPP